MKPIVLTVATDLSQTQRLIKSLNKFGWEYHVIIPEQWKGFGTKIIETYNYLKEHTEINNFVFCDAYDVVAMGTPEEFVEKLERSGGKDKMRLSTEKGLWPPILHPFRSQYIIQGAFNFVNSGLYYAPSSLFIEIVEKFMLTPDIDDQYWLNMVWLFKNTGYNSLGSIAVLDKWQVVFNSHSFIAEGEYTYQNGRVQIMDNEPVFIHSNGKTIDEKLEALL